MKQIKITFRNGEQYLIPLHFIAKHRAEYYVESDIKCGDLREEFRDKEIQEEIDFIVNEDTYEGISWLQNNFNWNEIKDIAVKLTSSKEYNYEEEFFNADFDVIEME